MISLSQILESVEKKNLPFPVFLGLPVQKPLFMNKNKKPQKEESSESDAEWTPAVERQKEKKKPKGKMLKMLKRLVDKLVKKQQGLTSMKNLTVFLKTSMSQIHTHFTIFFTVVTTKHIALKRG